MSSRRRQSFPDVRRACAAALLRAGLSTFQDGDYTGQKRPCGDGRGRDPGPYVKRIKRTELSRSRAVSSV